MTNEMSQLLDADMILTVAETKLALIDSAPSSQITYLLWDTRPTSGWLPTDYPRTFPSLKKARPLYLGKSAGLSRLRTHLAKEGFGNGQSKVTTHSWKNPGLLSYCLGKCQAGWLGVTYFNHGIDEVADRDSEALERAGVEFLGWRRDLGQIRRSERFTDPESLVGFYSPIHARPMPINEGLLLNQTDPKPDGRKRRFA